METSFVAVSLMILAIFALGFTFGVVFTLFVGQYSRTASGKPMPHPMAGGASPSPTGRGSHSKEGT